MCQVGCSKKSEDDKKKRNKYRSLSLSWVGRWFGIVKRGASAGRKKGSGHEKGEGVVIVIASSEILPGTRKAKMTPLE